ASRPRNLDGRGGWIDAEDFAPRYLVAYGLIGIARAAAHVRDLRRGERQHHVDRERAEERQVARNDRLLEQLRIRRRERWAERHVRPPRRAVGTGEVSSSSPSSSSSSRSSASLASSPIVTSLVASSSPSLSASSTDRSSPTSG